MPFFQPWEEPFDSAVILESVSTPACFVYFVFCELKCYKQERVKLVFEKLFEVWTY